MRWTGSGSQTDARRATGGRGKHARQKKAEGDTQGSMSQREPRKPTGGKGRHAHERKEQRSERKKHKRVKRREHKARVTQANNR